MLKKRSEFTRHALIMITGAAIAQMLPVLVSPVLTRIFAPQDFGIFAVFTAITTTISVAAAGRYEMVIMVPDRNCAASQVFALALIVSLLFCVVFSLVAPFLPVAEWAGSEELAGWVWMMPASIFFLAAFKTLGYWLSRHKQYSLLSRLRVIQGGAVSAASVGLGLIWSGPGGLIVGALIGQVASTALGLRGCWATFQRKWPLSALLWQARRYRQYPLVSMPSALLDTLTQQLPVLCFARFYDTMAAGYFNLGVRVLSAPASIVSASIAQIYFQRISDCVRNNPGETLHEVVSTAKKLAALALLIFFPFFFFGEWIFGLVFGKVWILAGGYSEILVLSIFIKFIVSPLSTIFIVVEKHWVIARWQVFYFFATIAAIVVGVQYSPKTLLWILVMTDLIVYGVYFLLIILLSKRISSGKV